MEYKFSEIEEKWKQAWAEKDIYKVTEDSTKPKYYVMDMFPYPSGAGLHVGHPLGYVASDIYARYKRLKGFNVLHPMGFDAFGLPAEQYAIETGTHPAITTEKAIKRYREQLDKIGFSFDWSRAVKTSDPAYYKWTQWIFLKLFGSWYNRAANKAELLDSLIKRFETEGCINWTQHDKNDHAEFTADDWQSYTHAQKEAILMNYRLAFLSYAEVNWCAALGTVLANDEIKDGKSERGGYPVERKRMRQWFLRITEYSDRLLQGLESLDWSESMKDMQRNWIGRSEGALIDFKTTTGGLLKVFTTRPDTIFGATFVVIAPEHDLVEPLTTSEQKAEIENYISYVKSRTDVERQQEKRVTGGFTGSYVINTFNGEKIPVWIAEYVLAGYGTGAIMAVPADDERDRKFAEKFGLPIIDIIDKSMHPGATIEDKIGKMINSDFLNGLEVKDAIKKILDKIEELGIGRRKVNYRQRDASYSRQRYWGEPFPIKFEIVGEKDAAFEGEGESNDIPIPLDVSQLPLVLPEVSSYKPTGDGKAPLANNADWVKNGYETDIMPGYAGSSWYFFRYMDPNNDQEFAAKDKMDYWGNVDLYIGGSEHAVGHLLYARMWCKFLYDLGYVNVDEPFKKLVNQGMIQGVSAKIFRINRRYLVSKFFDFRDTKYPTKIFYKTDAGEHAEVVFFEKHEVFYSNDWVGEETEVFYQRQEAIEQGGWINIDVSAVTVGCISDFERLFEWRKELRNAIFVSKKGYFMNGEFKPFPNVSMTDGVAFMCKMEVEKMSKSKYNVVNPDDVIEKYGADCFRMFEMFLGPIEQSKPWDDKGISGVSNFLRKFWRLFYSDAGDWKVTNDEPAAAEFKVLHKTLKKVSEDIERIAFNTCVSSFMICVNELGSLNCHKKKVLEPLVIALAPFAPFITEELWGKLGNNESVHLSSFPAIEEQYLVENSFDYPVSINGKVRAQVAFPLDMEQDEIKRKVLELENIQKWTNGAEPKKFIFVKGKIINVVV